MNGTLKEFEKILNKHQTVLNNNLIKTNTKLTYKNEVMKVVDDFIAELKEKKMLYDLYKYRSNKQYQTSEYNLVVESVAKMLSTNNIRKIDDDTRISVYNKYPILIYNLLLNSNINEVQEITKKMIDVCKTHKYVQTEFELTQLLDYCENFDVILKNNSALCIFNNFYGINFKKVGIKFNDLHKTNTLIINVGYNFKQPQNNIVYTLNKQYPKFFLDEDILDQFKFMNKIQIQPKDKLYQLNKGPNELYTIVINYNNSTDDKECYYSMTDQIYTEVQINNLLNGGLLSGIPRISYEIYVSTLFYKYINRIDKSKENMGEVMSKIYPCIKAFYNINPTPTIKKWIAWGDREFQDPTERKMFKIYLDKLYQLMDEENKLDYFKYISHISNYFVIELS